MGGDSTTKLSKTGADLHQQAWRPGTQIAYKSAWGKWASWCSEQSFNPFQTIVYSLIKNSSHVSNNKKVFSNLYTVNSGMIFLK
jgi:hypothetical protein